MHVGLHRAEILQKWGTQKRHRCNTYWAVAPCSFLTYTYLVHMQLCFDRFSLCLALLFALVLISLPASTCFVCCCKPFSSLPSSTWRPHFHQHRSHSRTWGCAWAKRHGLEIPYIQDLVWFRGWWAPGGTLSHSVIQTQNQPSRILEDAHRSSNIRGSQPSHQWDVFPGVPIASSWLKSAMWLLATSFHTTGLLGILFQCISHLLWGHFISTKPPSPA